jgi:hypothetical protein
VAVPESQLETWSHQGAVATAKATHESVRRALAAAQRLTGREFEVFLQGSYKNDTNIRGDSDVDLVVQLNSTFHRDLSGLEERQRLLYEGAHSEAIYHWHHFRADVLAALRWYYGHSAVQEGRNALSIAAGTSRLPADVIVATQYRKYLHFWSPKDQRWIEGIAFFTRPENHFVVNYPKPHYENGVAKNSDAGTNGWYKPSVRMFKNARTYLINRDVIDGAVAPSYFVECLLYNVPDTEFGDSFRSTYFRVVRWLLQQDLSGFMCQNGQVRLFGPTPQQWSQVSATTFLKALAHLWDTW